MVRAVRRGGELLHQVEDGRRGQKIPNAKSEVAPTFSRYAGNA